MQRNDHLRLNRLENLMGAKPMTNESDILGRKAARHPTPEPVIDLSDDSWRGEHHWRVRRNEGCQQAFSMSNVKRNAMKIRKVSA